ncbi:SpaA isopeptide-forming pilin-related protein [Anaerovorax odorimutans]|uniref:SpaA isopeptide-forming pilin-related protein n=1 Tax=Anaerovorax odorimutans TaxID=109327 RepID=UPI000429BF75|nr:SpaA isopeptide-forming pilin-related protein [Anaerovorax odorimutans]
MKLRLRKCIGFILITMIFLMTMSTAAFAGSISDLHVESVSGNKVTLSDMTVKITNDGAQVGEGDVIDPTKDMTMRVDFSIPDDRWDIKEGDYLQVVLPKYLTFSKLNTTEIIMKIADGSSVVLGNVTVSENIATLTFTDALENEDYFGRGGWFSAGLTFDEKKVETTEDKVVMTIFGKTFTIKVKPEIEPEYISLEKKGEADIANGEILWTVKATPSKEDKTYDGYVFEDVISDKVSFIKDSFTISPSAFKASNFQFDDSTKTIKYTFDNDITGVQTITYKTKINDLAKNNNNPIEVNNVAVLSDASTTTSASAIVKVTPELISKEGKYKEDNHSVDWTITVNKSSATLKDVVVTDIPLSSGMTFNGITIDDKELTTDNTKPQYYTLVGQTVKIYLGDINKKVVIKINTKLDDTVQANVKNKANITWNDVGSSITGGGSGASDIGTGDRSAYISTGFIKKSTDGNYDFKKNEMPWKIEIDKAGKEIKNSTVVEIFAYNTDEVSFVSNKGSDIKTLLDGSGFEKYKYDNVNYNQRYIDGTLNIEGVTANALNESDSFTAKGQYKVTTKELDSSIEVQILEIYLGDVTSTEKIHLKTKYTDKKAYGINSKSQQYKMTNYACLHYGDSNDRLYAGASEYHYSCVLDKEYEGSYNYVDRTITWRLYVNHNSLDIDNGIIEDTLPKYWKVDGDDFYEIYKGGKVNLGNGKATIEKEGNKLTDTEVSALIKHVEVSNKNEDEQVIKFEFNKISDKYVILIKTKLSDEGADKLFAENKGITVRNTAGISGSTVVNTQSDWEAVYIKNNIISKSGALDKDGSGKYTGDAVWTIDVNKNSINLPVKDGLDKVYVIDKLEDYLEPKMDGDNYAISMWKMKLDAGGNETKDSEVDQAIVQEGITYENKTLRIKLPETNGSYRIKLVTRITSDTVTEINNSASLEGVKTEIVTKDESVKIEYADGGAWANLAGKINLTKKAEGVTGKVLQGAVFELYELSGADDSIETFKYKKVTDKDGKITFKRLKSGKYKLVEITAPIGYEIDDSSASKIIELNTLTEATVDVEITNKVLLRAIQILKTDELGNALGDAEFTLYKDALGDKNIVGKSKSAENGSVTFKDVEMGTYYIVETALPTGYLKDTSDNVIKAVVDKDGKVSYFTGKGFSDTVKDIPTIKNIAYKGNISISKVDKAGNPLKGAKFTLYDENKNIVASSISEGDNAIAKFENIRRGNYTIKETAAPSGYVTNGEVLNIKASDFTKDNIELTFTVENEKRSHSGGGGSGGSTSSDSDDSEELNIDDNEVPLGPIIEDPNTEQNMSPITIEDEKIPLGSLPITGGFGKDIFYGLGVGLIILGTALRKKLKNS